MFTDSFNTNKTQISAHSAEPCCCSPHRLTLWSAHASFKHTRSLSQYKCLLLAKHTQFFSFLVTLSNWKHTYVHFIPLHSNRCFWNVTHRAFKIYIFQFSYDLCPLHFPVHTHTHTLSQVPAQLHPEVGQSGLLSLYPPINPCFLLNFLIISSPTLLTLTFYTPSPLLFPLDSFPNSDPYTHTHTLWPSLIFLCLLLFSPLSSYCYQSPCRQQDFPCGWKQAVAGLYCFSGSLH